MSEIGREAVAKLNEAQKARLRVAKFYLCDICSKPILRREDGIVIQGNVYDACVDEPGGLVGNSFPTLDPEGAMRLAQVSKHVFCRNCFLPVLFGPKSKAAAEEELDEEEPETVPFRQTPTKKVGFRKAPPPPARPVTASEFLSEMSGEDDREVDPEVAERGRFFQDLAKLNAREYLP